MTDITIPPLDLLEDIAAELARCASGAGDRVNARALNKAALHLPALHAVLRFSAGDLLIPSATTTNQVYRVSGAGCSCAAGAHGAPCWHSAAAEIILVARERQADADDGDAGDDGADDGIRAFDAYAPTTEVAPEPFWCDEPPPAPAAWPSAADVQRLAARLTRARAARYVGVAA